MFETKVKTKPDAELLDIILNPNKYDPAFLTAALNEIKSRELKVETSELENFIAKAKEKKEERIINWKVPEDLPGSIKLASNLVFLSVLLGLVNMYFIQTSFSIGGSTAEQLPGILSLVFVIAIGYGIRLGITWIRILLSAFYLLEILLGFSLSTFLLHHAPIAGAIYLLQSLIQLGVIIMLFMKPSNEWYKIKTASNNK